MAVTQTKRKPHAPRPVTEEEANEVYDAAFQEMYWAGHLTLDERGAINSSDEEAQKVFVDLVGHCWKERGLIEFPVVGGQPRFTAEGLKQLKAHGLPTRDDEKTEADPEFRKLRRTVLDLIPKKLGPGDDWIPVIQAFDGGPEPMIIGIPRFGEAKDEHIERFPSVLREVKATSAALVLSTWKSAATEENMWYRPSEDPRRIEALYVTLSDGVRDETWMADIKRSPDGTPHLGEWVPMGFGGSGRLNHVMLRSLRWAKGASVLPPSKVFGADTWATRSGSSPPRSRR